MAQKPTTNAETNKYAVVTGSNKGIGFEICRKLASHGITVILTSRDEKRGLEAVEKLKKESGFSDNIIFHQLNTMDPASVKSLAEFIKSQFGKLDILVNNAGVLGTIWNVDVLKAEEELKADAIGEERDWNATRNWNELTSYTRDLTVECIETNYYSTKRITEALLPLLQLSNSPRIVNVSSEYGKLKNIPNEWAKSILKDAENLTEERIETVLNEYLKEDFKEESLEKKGWPWIFGPYKMSKAAMNAYTRILAKKYPHFRINCVCPGFVKTDMNYNTGMITVEEGVESPVKLALLPDDGPTGAFFVNNEVSSFEE